jgi:hypothetical protein
MRRSDRTRQLVIATLVATFTFGITSPSLHAAAPRVVPEGEKLNDPRLGELKHLDNYFPFTPSKDAAAWKERAEYVRRQILVSNGLWPMPTRSPLKPVIHRRVDRDDYTVERVYMETFPGLYLTGSLYRPKNKTGKLPAVLCPHGHWANGRFYDAGENGLKGELKSGA